MFYTAKDYEKAAIIFEKDKQFQQAAECFKVIGDFKKAADMFEESGVCLKAFECYEHLNDWDGLLHCLSRNKDKFSDHEKDTLINRYVPIALNCIYQTINDDGFDEQNKGKILESKYKNHKIEVIKEESDDSSDSESQDNSKEEDQADEEQKEPDNEKTQENFVDKEKELQEDNESDQEQDINEKNEEEIIDTSSNHPELIKKNKSSVLNESGVSSFDMISKEDLAQDFDHLSNFDPDDEFLKTEKSFSIIGSVLCKDEDTLSEYSDFSIVSGSRISEIIGANELKPDKDYQKEDLAIQKIIYYMSLFSDDVKKLLGRLRSKEGLINLHDGKASVDYFELQLDNIDDEMASIILDMLEHFDMFRL